MKTASRGKSLESLILASQGAYVVLEKVPNGVKTLAGGRVVRCKSIVDFMGTVTSSGRAIVFDAKQCDLKHRFPVGNADHVTPDQRATLIRHGKAGAIAGLLVNSTYWQLLYWLSWQQLQAGTPSMRWSELTTIGLSTHAVDFGKLLRLAGETP